MEWFITMLGLPEAVGLVDVTVLAVASFFASMLSAAAGIGGGVALLAVMAQILPGLAIVPVHGAVQWGSNAGRVVLLRAHVNWQLVLYFLVGSVVGAFIGGQVVVSLPVAYIQLILGVFILYSTWGPKPKLERANEKVLLVCGLLSTILTMFVGATGPFVSVVLKRMNLGKFIQVATMSSCLVLQHSAKVVVFALLGFSFAPYVPLIVLLVAVGFVGTVIGRQLLDRISEALFTKILSVVLTLLAVRLLWFAGNQLLVGGAS
ncbi:MAG: sulfite exporter TauE/SafE family protein [Kordiimonadaceae bacterium]|nr:sulfite exporter TauE/SafE family protein [Kordiimonadaceae bacterium]